MFGFPKQYVCRVENSNRTKCVVGNSISILHQLRNLLAIQKKTQPREKQHRHHQCTFVPISWEMGIQSLVGSNVIWIHDQTNVSICPCLVFRNQILGRTQSSQSINCQDQYCFKFLCVQLSWRINVVPSSRAPCVILVEIKFDICGAL